MVWRHSLNTLAIVVSWLTATGVFAQTPDQPFWLIESDRLLKPESAKQQVVESRPPKRVAMVVDDIPAGWVSGSVRGDENAIGSTGTANPMSTSPVNSSAVARYVQELTMPSQTAGNFRPWWDATVTTPLQISDQSVIVDGDHLILETLQHSFRISALRDGVSVARSNITRAAAEFDPSAFVESRFVRTSVPTGSELDAGSNIPRLREEDFAFSAGLRRRTETGAQFEVGQQVGLRDSNSLFFTPQNQGNSRLTLSFNQPLLNGAGRAVNRSLIVLAKLDKQIASFDATTQIQDHLLDVQRAMWDLYFHRTSLLLRIRHLEQAVRIKDWLDRRTELDSLQNQIKRAGAAIATRRAELSRALTAIRNAEDRLRALVNSPLLTTDKTIEIVPTHSPSIEYIDVSLEDAIVTALENRSEVSQVAREMDTARVRLNIARNELLPMLDVVLESYLSGLRGSNDIGRSWIDQFSVGEPSYSAGLLFEVPLWRRAAKANITRRQAELRQLSNRLSEMIAELHVEVAAALREVDTSHREVGSRMTSMLAARDYVNLLARRWRELPGEGYSANALLEDLLDAQDRLLAEEAGFARAQIDYALSTTLLKRTTGTLLQVDAFAGPSRIPSVLDTAE